MTADEPLHFPGYEFEPPTPDGPEARPMACRACPAR